MTTSNSALHWADVLELRPEVRASDGSVGELQMSLHKAVYQTVDVPYRKVEYYGDITEPTPNLVGFFARVARRLGTSADAPALFHLDQGMGGGKSHALVGLYHMANSPEEFFATELGQQVYDEAARDTATVNLTEAAVVTLTADYFSPGSTSEVFGPATNLFERFLWALVGGDMDRYQRHVASGPNKGTLQQALTETGRPVLILLDELMDYVMALADVAHIDTMPGEKAFLNALMDACDDVPQVAFVVVMIRSELDERGYSPAAVDFRDYVGARLVRNGQTVAVTEAQDFSAIIRRRLFELPDGELPLRDLTRRYAAAADGAWRQQVFDKLGANRGLPGFEDRTTASYPFHPELMRLVREEWSQVSGFQRVRSTVAIFARTALHWVTEHKAGRWAPPLIGVGDIPLTVALEQLLSSGLLLGNDRAIQGYRAVANTDITSTDGRSGRAVNADATLRRHGVTVDQPTPAVRMATALLCYSIVSRGQGRRGATKAELMLAIFGPAGAPVPYPAAEEVFNTLTGDDGLGALEVTTPNNAPDRYHLSIKQTLRMYFTAAMAVVPPEARGELVWEQAQRLASKGVFDNLVTVDKPTDEQASLEKVFEGVDSTSTRLVLLDPRRWTLLNGKDSASRQEITALLGLGDRPLRVDNAASCVVACVNTQRRDIAFKRAAEVLAWREVIKQLTDDTEDELKEARAKHDEALDKLRRDIERAYQHYAYLVRAGELHVEYKRFDEDTRTALNGGHVWAALIDAGRATQPAGLAAGYLAALLANFGRDLTPREIVQSFYKNPAFPLVTSTDEIRRVLYQLINDDWELVDADGERLAVAGPEQIAITSINQTVRRRAPEPVITPVPTLGGGDEPGGGAQPGGGEQPGGGGQTGGQPPGGGQQPGLTTPPQPDPGPTVYKRYRVQLSNKSITGGDAREQAWQLLQELRKVIDPANQADHQLLSLDLTLVTAEGQQGAIGAKAQALGAHVTAENDDF
ncbi:MAG: putative ATPase superfamily [Frankiales bacterium]|nr:putative ATPase superfamily [Frankiales bacterium]